jgi:hypothetical protein
MLEKNPVHILDSQDLVKNLRVEIKIEKVSQVEWIGGLDDFRPKVTVN